MSLKDRFQGEQTLSFVSERKASDRTTNYSTLSYMQIYQSPEKKTPLLILHGWGSCAKNWSRIKELLEKQGVAELRSSPPFADARVYEVFVPTFPGLDETPDPPYPWWVKDYADWVLNFANEKKLERFFLLGHSFGGRVAVKFASLYPEKLLGLILVDAAVIERGKNLELRQKIILRIVKFKHFIVSFPFFGRLFYPFLQKLSYFLAGTKDYYLIKSPVMKETFKKIIEEDLTPCLSQISTPTLIIWGEKDKIVPLKNAYSIKEKIPNSKLEILPKIGHNPHLEAPEKLVEIILDFLEKNKVVFL